MKTTVPVTRDTLGKLWLLKIRCKAKDLDSVIKDLIKKGRLYDRDRRSIDSMDSS